MTRSIIAGGLMALCLTSIAGADESVVISEARKDDSGFLVHEVRSPYQAQPTKIRVLHSEKLEKNQKRPVVYVLPVEAGTDNRYGDGLQEIKKLDFHNKFGVVFVAPTFSHLPWYADNPTRPEIRQESYFIKVVVPFIDKSYRVRDDADGRLLLGFSKSGWGAWSLLLRHPDLFHRAAAWDSPVMMDRTGEFGSGEIFGTAENFEQYRLGKLWELRANHFRQERRLLLLGYGNFRTHHENAHAQMEKLKIAHEYRDGPARKHDWHGGWVSDAVELLLGPQ